MSVREGWGHYRDLKECQWKEEDQELKIKNFFFSRTGTKLWNGIPHFIRDLPKKAFKRELNEKAH